MDLLAPSHWCTLDFISDVHLFEQDRPTFDAWKAYLERCPADALFILGDLFEVWVGDDALIHPSDFSQACIEALRCCARQRPVFFMPGNRDFLVGDDLLQWTGMQRLPDPCTLVFHGQRLALTHGDALCTDDLPYQQFRAEVRTTQWKRNFLAKPLAQRDAIARAIRQDSENRKQANGYTDVNATAVQALLDSLGAEVLIHGHTHEGSTHALGASRQRVVLSDWCATATPPRLEVLRLQAASTDSTSITRIPLH